MDEATRPGAPPDSVEDPSPGWLARLVSRLRRLKGPIVAIAAGGTILGGLAGYWNGWRTVRSSLAETAATAPQSAVAPFSAADRRMTFAVLPFQAPAGDAEGARLALAAAEVLQSVQDSKTVWARVVPRPLVEQQAALLACKALVHMTRSQRADSGPGSEALVPVAAESRAGRIDPAHKALGEFQQVAPNVRTVAQIKAWLRPYWVAPGGDVFWQALKNAGVEG